MGQSWIFSMNNGIRFSNGAMISFTFGRVQGAKWDIVVKAKCGYLFWLFHAGRETTIRSRICEAPSF
jgi:hypothetical protein